MNFKRQLKKQKRMDKFKADMGGSGLYIFQNPFRSELRLPRATHSGRVNIGPHEMFEGDSYYLSMVDRRELIKVLTIKEGDNMQQHVTNKLLTEVPPTVTTQGTVEYVEEKIKTEKPLHENQPPTQQQEVFLLNESPLDGVKIVL